MVIQGHNGECVSLQLSLLLRAMGPRFTLFLTVALSPCERGRNDQRPGMLWLLSFIALFIILNFSVSRETECVRNLMKYIQFE